MRSESPSLRKLITQLQSLPGIGYKSARRLAFYIIKLPISKVEELSAALVDAKRNLKLCSICFNLSDSDPCFICNDYSRDRTILCVVEQPQDIITVERTGEFKGLYHVLQGALSPMDGIGPDNLKMKELINRLVNSFFKEIILATDPNVEGEATAIYLMKLLKPLNFKVTRIAQGLSVGSDLEYADEVSLSIAFKDRLEW
ncbi:MAG: Recombination protein RecR [candidate division WS2 bacterium]|uniref:Recombination protein RecR n=1 Tax=Psychracetigena formicireducens TaxID=2986056 RepID=A0A9E2BEX2_PSYF1|nr:Recombination protein RecR [Candidatus Psychracetigena formicireducens]MBT9144335.1 Recombination protein RecR [Candidatus Psychracetigena formicireducens]MBT9151310.1 Recombination protein RecR [Candidatus Psychracetigena formicireducens]